MSEIDELKAKLERITSHVGCMYCGKEYAYSQKDELADHITSCEKSPLVQMVNEMESRITDYMDLMNDEFCRIVALNPGPEITNICQRAMTIIHQKVPVITQRDDLLKKVFEVGAERDQLKAELAQARAHNAALLEACDQLPNLLCDVGQLLDGWHNDGTCWSAWDESVRKRVSEAQTKIEEGNKLRAAIALEKGEK